MAEESTPLLPAEQTATEAAAGEPNKKDERAGAAEAIVHDAAHAAATVEAEAAIAAAKAEADAAKIAEASGERAAQKFLEAKLTEIETAANARIEGLKKWLDERLSAIEGKKTPKEEPESAEGAAAASELPPVPAPAAQPQKDARSKKRWL